MGLGMADLRSIKEVHDIEEDPCCPNPHIIVEDGMRVCQSCGMVVSRVYSDAERRAYNMDEVNNRRRTEPKWRCYGCRTVIGQINTDGRGNALQPRKRALFSRLNKIQSSLVNSLERNYWEAKPKLLTLCSKLALPNFVQETAWKIYSSVAKRKLTMGRSIEAFVGASLYAAIRVHDFPRLLEEVVDVAMISTRNMHKSLGIIVHKVLPTLNLRYKPLGPKALIYRFGNELNVSMGIQQNANSILKLASRQGLRGLGKDPKGLAAAAIYLSARDSMEKRTQSQIASIARITEVTLRTRAKQIVTYLEHDPIFLRLTGFHPPPEPSRL
jgi:transcription initiation factor TFIIB